MKTDFSGWEEYLPEGEGYLSPEVWGRDHWNTMAYLDACAVDRGGMIENARMRCNPRLHRNFAYIMPSGGVSDGSKYPTILKGGIKQADHDDWACLEDMVRAGYIKAYFKEKLPGQILMFGGIKAGIEFTDLGRMVANALRNHRAAGGEWDNFQVPGPA